MNGYIYALRLPNGLIKFGTTEWKNCVVERFMAARQKYGPETRPLGIARGTYAQENAIRKLFSASRVGRETYKPDPLVLRAVSMMAPFPPVPAPSQRLRTKFALAALP